jgi:glycosyltransferase involved in cell wall biosynthesis
MKPGKSICIISFSPIARDARVLRQIKYLSPHYRLTVIGYGPPHPAYADNPDITWIELDKKPPASPPRLITAWRTRDYANLKIAERIRNKARALITGASWYIGFVLPRAYELSYRFRRGWIHDAALARALESPCDAYHANDWKALPVAAEAARSTNARLVLDLHEYAPGQYEGRRFRMFDARMISYIIQKHATRVDASTTVAPLIAERYRERFHLDPLVVLSAPEWTELPRRALDPDNIRIVHHGVASRRRNPEAMIETIARCDRRYSLHFMLMENEYVKELRRRAEVMARAGDLPQTGPAPGYRVVPRTVRYRHLRRPSRHVQPACGAPEQILEFINAGLAVCIGPSPSMAELVHAHGMGIVGPTFSPGDMADAINRTTPAQWQLMRDRARTASQNLNAQTEMAKVVRIYQDLL